MDGYIENTRLEWDLLTSESTDANRDKENTVCPNCSDHRRKKKQKCLTIKHNDGKASCNHCGCYAFKDFDSKIKNDKFELPSQEWQNHTSLPDHIVKAWKSRGISQKTLNELNVTWERAYFHELKEEVDCLTFNAFVEDTIVRKKYRTKNPQTNTKTFTQSKNTRSIFFGLNSLKGQTKCILAEGEPDWLSFHEVFGDQYAIISPPNGANDMDDMWEHAKPFLCDIEEYYISADNDSSGNKFAESVAQRLGRWKCRRIKWSENDANDVLRKHGAIEFESNSRNGRKSIA